MRLTSKLETVAWFVSLAAVAVACSSSASNASSADGTSPNPNGKNDGAQCQTGADCKSDKCDDGLCAPSPLSASSAAPDDGLKNGDESDVDCGGLAAPKCASGKTCATADDCADGVCKDGTCAAPAPDDGVKNGDETDVDCGGTTAPKCDVAKACAASGDCASDACSYEMKCVAAKGCTGHSGGDTCGAGETGEAGAQHESCCTKVDIPQGGFVADKYLVTAGRMRAFAQRWNGNLKAWAATKPPTWNQAYTGNLPENMDDVNILLGPEQKRGCNVVNQGGRTFWQPGGVDGVAAEKSDFTQDVLDEKALNCVPWYMAEAVCAFDGGRLAKASEIKMLFENGTGSGYPFSGSYNPGVADDRLIHQYSYQTPNPPANLRTVGSGAGAYPLDHAFYIAPPGRRPKGADKWGVMDAAGNMLVWVHDQNKSFVWTMSWEQHPKNMTTTQWTASDGPEGYYALGARCAYDK